MFNCSARPIFHNLWSKTRPRSLHLSIGPFFVSKSYQIIKNGSCQKLNCVVPSVPCNSLTHPINNILLAKIEGPVTDIQSFIMKPVAKKGLVSSPSMNPLRYFNITIRKITMLFMGKLTKHNQPTHGNLEHPDASHPSHHSMGI